MRYQKKHRVPFLFVYILLSITGLLFIFGFQSFMQYANQYPCANSFTCARDLTGVYETKELAGIFHGKQVSVPSQLPPQKVSPQVLGDTTASNKHIYVDLAKQQLYAYEGDKLVYTFLVSTGLWGRTPTGDFRIWIKLRYTRMSGGNASIGTYYNLPNVPYVMFFSNNKVSKNAGYSLHGTYWHSNFGHPMSHGCVNMKTEEAALIYAWANPQTKGNTTYATAEDPGTLITIYGVAPAN